jgi:hypothetical protein
MMKIFLILIICGFAGQSFSQTEMKNISIGLNAAGDVLITKNGVKVNDMTASTSRDREPVYRVPIGEKDEKLTIRVSGQKENAKGDLGIAGNGFVVRVLAISLSRDKIIMVNLQTGGNKIDYVSNKPEETPSFSFAFDPPNATDSSYIFKLKRAKLIAKKKIIISLDAKNGTFNFSDNDVKGSYSLEITKINVDGSEEIFTNADISSKKANKFQLNFKDWKAICLQNDIDGKGFANDKCNPLK